MEKLKAGPISMAVSVLSLFDANASTAEFAGRAFPEIPILGYPLMDEGRNYSLILLVRLQESNWFHNELFLHVFFNL